MSSVEVFILNQPENLKPILNKLRGLIISASPIVEEKLAYGIPFFYGEKRIFYINPQKNWVDFGFCEGHMLAENPLLQIKNRTQVKTIRYYSIDEIDEDIILPIIHEAFKNGPIKEEKKTNYFRTGLSFSTSSPNLMVSAITSL